MNVKVKIGFCIDSLEMGGAEKLLVDIISLLYSTKKYEIYLLTKSESTSYFYNEIKEKINYYYLLKEKEQEKYKKIGKIGNLILSLKKRKNFKIFSSKVDFLIDFLDGDFYKFMKKIKNKKKFLWLHLNYKSLVLNKNIDKKLKYYNDIIVITYKMFDEITKLHNMKIHLLYNLLDTKKLDRLLNDRDSISEIDNNENFFLTVCRLDERQKDVTTLLKAFSKYNGKEKLYIIGDGRDKETLIKLTKELNLISRIKFLGIKENPYVYMRKCKAFILSSKYEGFGLVLVEALYCGAKVISSNCNYGPSEILLNGEIGELFEVGNVKELLKKLSIINKKNYDKEKIRESLKRFQGEIFLKKLEKILNDKKNNF